MRYRSRVQILKAAAMLILLCQLTACAKHYHTDNRRPAFHHYRKGGRAW